MGEEMCPIPGVINLRPLALRLARASVTRGVKTLHLYFVSGICKNDKKLNIGSVRR